MFYIRKSSGDKQRFNLDKFRRSLFKSGASEKTIRSIIRHIQKEKPNSTKRIHEITTELLKKQSRPVADRYNLKRALLELGPEGYSFELFIAELFRLEGYTAKSNRVIPGTCINHEVDVILEKKHEHFIVECKFHNRMGMKSDVKVTLYVQARFEDIRDALEKKEARKKTKRASIQITESKEDFHQAWVVTNTQFTSEAIRYGECKGMKLLGWGYPKRKSLADIIQKHELFPITTLTSLSRHQKRKLLKDGLVLCKNARTQKTALRKLGLKPQQISQIIKEAEAVCKI